MNVEDAQREVRSIYLGGFYGQLVSGGVWLVSAVLDTWVSQRAGILALQRNLELLRERKVLRVVAEKPLSRGHALFVLPMPVAGAFPDVSIGSGNYCMRIMRSASTASPPGALAGPDCHNQIIGRQRFRDASGYASE